MGIIRLPNSGSFDGSFRKGGDFFLIAPYNPNYPGSQIAKVGNIMICSRRHNDLEFIPIL